jgi:hypothetical protein
LGSLVKCVVKVRLCPPFKEQPSNNTAIKKGKIRLREAMMENIDVTKK